MKLRMNRRSFISLAALTLTLPVVESAAPAVKASGLVWDVASQAELLSLPGVVRMGREIRITQPMILTGVVRLDSGLRVVIGAH